MAQLVLLRHGESQWNLENRFTGWVDVPLSEKGVNEARNAGQMLQARGIAPDICFTSLLIRAIKTAEIALESMNRSWIPVERSWRLNERHYGALQGMDKKEAAEKYGKDQVKSWRRGYDVKLPEAEPKNNATIDERYAELLPTDVPRCECLKDVVLRLAPYYSDVIFPKTLAGKTPLVVAHGNSLRALVKILESISDTDIVELEIPTGRPRIYEISTNASIQSVIQL
jgi:2,3-bisphosphoglycerate-dependent phosphoglycerate mutase